MALWGIKANISDRASVFKLAIRNPASQSPSVPWVKFKRAGNIKLYNSLHNDGALGLPGRTELVTTQLTSRYLKGSYFNPPCCALRHNFRHKSMRITTWTALLVFYPVMVLMLILSSTSDDTMTLEKNILC